MAARSLRPKRAPRPAEFVSPAAAPEPRAERAERSAAAPSESSRRALVLEAALELVSNHGIAGMSLRMLARKLGIQQPSLYHYFDSKDALVDQIVEYCAEKMVESVMLDRYPDLPLEKLPFFVVERTLALWQTERHVRFARFLFVVSIESPKHRPVIRRVFEERLYGGAAREIAGALGGDEAERLTLALRMLVSALGLALMEERVLFGLEAPSDKTLSFARFMAESVARLLTPPKA